MHPNIAEYFYQKLDAPTNESDAHVKMLCHKHAADDCALQIEINQIEYALLCEDNKVMPYHIEEAEDLYQRRLRLLTAKRFHQNASHAYWYYLSQTSSSSTMK